MKRMLEKKYLASQVQIQQLLSGYTSDVASTKKIYCHPLTIFYSSTIKIRLTCLIFDNNSIPFTLNTFKEWLDNLAEKTSGSGRLMVSGAVNTSSKVIIASFLYRANDNTYSINGLDITGNIESYSSIDFTAIFPEGTTLIDGVNPIN